MATTVNTVTGPVSSDDLGKTLMHEHFFFGYPGYEGDSALGPNYIEEIIETGVEVAERAKAHGVETTVDATPNDCGRDPELLCEICERVGVRIICSTDYYFENEGAPAYFKFRQGLGSAPPEVEEMMTEITSGIGQTGIKAGVVKLASRKDEITDYEKMFFTAGAKAQRETGVPISTHTQEGTMGPEQTKFLVSAGADPDRVVIGTWTATPTSPTTWRLWHTVSPSPLAVSASRV